MLTKAEIQRLKSLREKKQREAAGLFVVEGPKVVGELLAAGCELSELYVTEDFSAPASRSTIHRITHEEMARISHYPTPSPVLAVGPLLRRQLMSAELNQGLSLALDGIQDPGNVGTLLRIADWFAFDRVLLSPDCADLFSQKVINASMGSFVRAKAYSVDLAATLREATVPVFGCDLEGENIHHLSAPRDAIIVIGSEGRGISPAVHRTLTQRITIPRLGGAESLNAGVAAGIVCAAFRRRA